MPITETLGAHGFPIGTVVSVYPVENYTGGQPAGTPVATATVASDGTLTFSNLEEDRSYVAYALGHGVAFRATAELSTSLAPYEGILSRIGNLERVVTEGGGGGTGSGSGLPQPLGSNGQIIVMSGGTPVWQNPGTASVTDGSITTLKLADNAVTTAKIADGQVTAAKVAADVATQAELDALNATTTAAISDIDARTLALESSPAAHTHEINDVNGLQAALDADDAALAAEITNRQAADSTILTQLGQGNGVLIETKEWMQQGSLAVGTAPNPIKFNSDKIIKSVSAFLVGGNATTTSLIVDLATASTPGGAGTTVFTTQANRPTIAVGQSSSSVQTPDVVDIPAGTYLQVQIDQVNAADAAKTLFVLIEVAAAGASLPPGTQPGRLAPANFDSPTSVNGVRTIDLQNAIYDCEVRLTLSGATNVLNFINVPVTARISIRVVQSATNSPLVIQQNGATATVKWENGTPHVMSTASGAVDRIVGIRAAANLELSTAGKGYA